MHIAFVDSNAVGVNALRAAKEAGHDVTFISSRRMQDLIGGLGKVASPIYSDRIIEIDYSLDEPELVDAVHRLNIEHRIDALLTVFEPCVLPVANCAKSLGLRCTSPSAVKLAQNKAECRARIEEAGILSVEHCVVSSLDDANRWASKIGYPIIAKPQRGVGSLFALRIDNGEQLREYFGKLDEMQRLPSGFAGAVSSEILLERYITGPLLSVELAVASGEFVPLMLSARKRCVSNPSIELGTTMPAPVSKASEQALKDYAISVAKCVGLDLGIFHIEVILSDIGPVLVEINPRIMGGNMPTLFKLATDSDPYILLIELFLSGRIPDYARYIKATRAATTRMIGTLHTGTVQADLSETWHKDISAKTAAWACNFRAGEIVSAMESSFFPHHFQVVRDTPGEASLLAEWLIASIGDQLGLPMRRSSEDYVFV